MELNLKSLKYFQSNPYMKINRSPIKTHSSKKSFAYWLLKDLLLDIFKTIERFHHLDFDGEDHQIVFELGDSFFRVGCFFKFRDNFVNVFLLGVFDVFLCCVVDPLEPTKHDVSLLFVLVIEKIRMYGIDTT